MTIEECKILRSILNTSISMADVSREAQIEAREAVGRALVKKIAKPIKNQKDSKNVRLFS